MGLSITGHIGLTIGGCILLCVIILITYCVWRRHSRYIVETQSNVNYLHQEQQPTKPRDIPKAETRTAITTDATSPNNNRNHQRNGKSIETNFFHSTHHAQDITKRKPKHTNPPIVKESMTIMLNDETIINPFATVNDDHKERQEHKCTDSILIETNEDEAYKSSLNPMDGRSSIRIHLDGDSFDADVDFTDHSAVDGNHGFGPSVQIHDEDLNEVVLTEDALPVDTLPSHYLSDSVESLDPDFVLEATYFEESEHSYSASPQESNQENWNMPGVSIDHTSTIQMLQSMEMHAPHIGQSLQYQAAPPIDTNKIGKSIQYIENKSMGGAGGEQFIMWQMHGRKLKNMTNEKLVEWLENSGFDNDTLDHFRQYKIDGKKLWQNIRNASMFLYNVGVVRPTLRDAIVQNIYLELLPKTPGFDERRMTDFKRLKLIADGPISTVYKAVIRKEALKLRESTVIIKGYHFAADDVRVGKIIQILVHLVSNVQSARFVKIHGFIRNMMEDSNTMERPMFGIVMQYCDGGSIRQMFGDGNRRQYNLEYNVMDKIGIITEVAMAMSELHSKNTLHKNLKASNVLMSNNDDIKLTDYCLDVTQLTDFTHSLDAKERSIRWMSPELIQTQTYTKQCDIYSFGITCYEILSGNKPYHQYNNTSDLLRRIIRDNLRPDIDDLANLPEDLLILMSNCWNVDVEKRPDFDEILQELDKIKDELRKSCITFDDVYARARASMMSDFKKNTKTFQSSPLLIMQNENNSDSDDYNTFDDYTYHLSTNNYDDDDDRKRPTHVKDDTALELDKIKNFEPRRRKRRPRKPLPKAPPVGKQLPDMNENTKIVNQKRVKLPDKPLPPKPLQPI